MYKSPFLSGIYDEMMRRRYAKRTIETYLHWIKNYIVFHNKQHPTLMGNIEVETYLDHWFCNETLQAQHKHSY